MSDLKRFLLYDDAIETDGVGGALALADAERVADLNAAADFLEAQAHRWLARGNGPGRSARQRDRFAVRGHKAAATLRCARTLRERAAAINDEEAPPG